MAEYDLIERNKIFEKVTKLYRYSKGDMHIAYRELLDYILDMPAADVQLVDRWISVEDRLPEGTATVLVWYTSNTLFGLSEGYGLSWYSPTAKWYKNELNGENIAVRYWQPLPEPPKEG